MKKILILLTIMMVVFAPVNVLAEDGGGGTTDGTGGAGREDVTDGDFCQEFGPVLSYGKKIYNIVKYAAPAAVVIIGALDFAKVVTNSDPDKESSKAGKKFIQRLIAAAIVLLMFAIVQFIMNLIAQATGNSADWASCWNSI